MQGSGPEVQVEGRGSRVHASVFGVKGLGFRVKGSRSRVQVQALRSKVNVKCLG